MVCEFSFFIGTLAFEEQPLEYQVSVKVGVLLGSILSALIGAFILAKAGNTVISLKE